MRYFCPNYMDHPEETDKESFLSIMLKHRPEYAILWDVIGSDVQEFHHRVWVVQYVAVRGDNVYYSGSRHYAKRARALFKAKNIIKVETEGGWASVLPEEPEFKKITYYAPDVVEEPTEIDMEDFINKMLTHRPPYAVLWNVTFDDIEYMASRVYVVSYMPVIDDTIYYSYAKHFAFRAKKQFNIAQKKKISIQAPEF